MGMLDRYNKKGGFVQLLNLLETTPGAKKEKFLKMIAEESPEWEAELQKKMLSLERISKWPTQTIMEILPRIPANIVAIAIRTLPDDQKNAFMNAYSHFDKRKIEDTWKESNATPGEVAACQMKIFTEIRGMVAGGMLKFDVVDPDMVIPPNIEETLSMAGASGLVFDIPSTTSAPATSGSAPAGGIPQATQEEIMMLRKKLHVLTQENHKLNQQLQQYKDKLEQIRKIA